MLGDVGCAFRPNHYADLVFVIPKHLNEINGIDVVRYRAKNTKTPPNATDCNILRLN
jgi:hypothetical protein